MVYEIAITLTPTVVEAQAGGQEKLVLPFTTVVAANPNSALLAVGVANAEALSDVVKNRADNLQVKIRAS